MENRLFATLDPTTKRTALPGGTEILLTDTVGFIRKLPHDLIDAFHSTLEEALTADFLIHVVDASNQEVLHHIETTEDVLRELGAVEIPSLLVFNKIDLCTDPFHVGELKRRYPQAIFVSVKQKKGIESFAPRMEKLVFPKDETSLFRLPNSRYDLAALLHRGGSVLSEKYEDSTVTITARVSEKLRGRLSEYLLE